MLSPDRPVTSKDIPAAAADVLARIRARAPRVHCITNVVAQNFSANMLLAAGAIPSMTIAPDEVGEFVARADALLINLGTFDAERRIAAGIAIDAIAQQRQALAARSGIRRALAAAHAVCEIAVGETAARRAAEPGGICRAWPAANSTARRWRGSAKATTRSSGLTGETDIVFGAGRLACVANGDPLMAKVTAMGCAGSALVGACLAVESDAWIATASGLLILGVAGQIAAQKASGPGSLAVGILDAIYALDGATLIEQARVI